MLRLGLRPMLMLTLERAAKADQDRSDAARQARTDLKAPNSRHVP